MTLPRLPLVDSCAHYYYAGKRYGCHLLGDCAPASENRSLSGCEKFQPVSGVSHRQRSDKPKMTIEERAAANRRCRDAKAAGRPCTEFAPNRSGIVVPQPPPLLLTPISPRAVVTVCVGDEAKRCLEVTEPYMRLYAARVGADFVKLDWSGHPAWPMSAKFAIGRVLEHYDRIAYVDADVLLRPGCVDLFEACRPDEFGAVDQLPHHNAAMSNYLRDYLDLRASLGFGRAPVPWYFNAGVMVASKEHARYLLPPKTPLPARHCAEQEHSNAVILDAIQAGKVKIRLLDRRCNWQSWQDPGFKTAPADAILHWSGAGDANRARRAADMKAWADRYPLPLSPTVSPWTPPPELFPTPHGHYADARHVRMIHGELMTGRHRRVLEIGCFHGYSTCAFLDALSAGKVQELHLCDVQIRAELRRAIAHYGIADRMFLHEVSSLTLLAGDSDFNFVFVDGDHGEATVAKEAALLLKAGVPTVFAHDTGPAAHLRYGVAKGPARLAAMFRADPRYACFEDAQVRAGERTDRGLFLARLKRSTSAPSCRLSIIIATSGRVSIGRTLASITPQLKHGDELIVERDSTDDMAATPRTRGMLAATGDYLLFIDDDDVYTLNALDMVRRAIGEHPGRPHLFAMTAGAGWKLPQHGRDVRVENVSTQMIVLPNEPAKFGQWGPRRRGDFDFIQSALLLWDEPPVWHDDVIAIWR